MQKGHLQARLYVGNKVELIGCNKDKARLVVLLSSRLEQERGGASGDIFDSAVKKVIYRCRRSIE